MSGASLEPGAVVKLAGGSPPLTVSEVIPERGQGSRELCRVMWFEAGKLSEALIPSAALRAESVKEAEPAAGTTHACSRDVSKGDAFSILTRCGRPEEYRAKDPFAPREAYLCGECWRQLSSEQQANYQRSRPAFVCTLTSTQNAAVPMPAAPEGGAP